MLKTLTEKISKFVALHPQVVMYGISIGVTLGITLSIALVANLMDPHDAFAKASSTSQSGREIWLPHGAICSKIITGNRLVGWLIYGYVQNTNRKNK
jgi:hypothetical protein